MGKTINSKGNKPSNSIQRQKRSCKRPVPYADIAKGRHLKNRVQKIKSSDKKAKVPDKILGATMCNGEIIFMMKWKGGNDGTMISLDEAHKKYPQELIKFYEKNYSFVKCKN